MLRPLLPRPTGRVPLSPETYRGALKRFRHTVLEAWSAQSSSMPPLCGIRISGILSTHWSPSSAALPVELSGIIEQLQAAQNFSPGLISPCLVPAVNLARLQCCIRHYMATLTGCPLQGLLSRHQGLSGVVLIDFCNPIHGQILIDIHFFLPLSAFGIVFLWKFHLPPLFPPSNLLWRSG